MTFAISHDKAGNLTFNPLAKLAGQPADGCGLEPGDPPCGPGLEYVYDAENRLVAIHRDTNDAADRLSAAAPNRW